MMVVFPDVPLLILLCIAAASDLKHRKIYNWLTFPAIAYGFLNSYMEKGFQGVTESLIGLSAGALFLLPFFILGGIGGGDVKLSAAVGSIKGWSFALFGICMGSVAAGLYCLVLAWGKGDLLKIFGRVRNFFLFLFTFKEFVPIDKEDTFFIPYGVFLCLGFFLNFL